jgi:hypothetical protein
MQRQVIRCPPRTIGCCAEGQSRDGEDHSRVVMGEVGRSSPGRSLCSCAQGVAELSNLRPVPSHTCRRVVLGLLINGRTPMRKSHVRFGE